MHKMNTLQSMSPNKREFMIKVVKIISEDSYLKEHMGGEMPEQVKKLLLNAGIK